MLPRKLGDWAEGRGKIGVGGRAPGAAQGGRVGRASGNRNVNTPKGQSVHPLKLSNPKSVNNRNWPGRVGVGTHFGKIPHTQQRVASTKDLGENNNTANGPNSRFPCRQRKHQEYCGGSQQYMFPQPHTVSGGIRVANTLGPRAYVHECDLPPAALKTYVVQPSRLTVCLILSHPRCNTNRYTQL